MIERGTLDIPESDSIDLAARLGERIRTLRQ